MQVAAWLLLLIGLLGAFDVWWFHGRLAQVATRPECRREHRWHVARHLVYAVQLAWVPHLRFHRAALWILVVLYAADVFVAVGDVLSEPDSRRAQGGLPRGEYLTHVILSVLVGAYFCAIIGVVWQDRLLPSAIVIAPPDVPLVVRALLSVMSLGVFGLFVVSLLPSLRRPGKIVVEVEIEAPVEEVWRRTQTPELHCEWDIRFDAIRVLPGTERGSSPLEYETRIGFGLSVIGQGRYLQDVENERSVFEFDSEDPRSLITRGKGVWLYRAISPTRTRFRTVFDYEARFGLVGGLFDRLVFRPMFRLATEWGFETLRRQCEGRPVAGRRSRARFTSWALSRPLFPTSPATSWLDDGRHDPDHTRLRARQRVERLVDFHGPRPSGMGRLHIAASCAVALAELSRGSRAFDAIGDMVMPDLDREPWQRYVAGADLPDAVRDELWLEAHLGDVEAVARSGLLRALEAEGTTHRARRHVAIVLAERPLDRAAIDGECAVETAASAVVLERLPSLLWLFVVYGARAIGRGIWGGRVRGSRLSEREVLGMLLRNLAGLPAWIGVVMRGVSSRDRGALRANDRWDLIARALGPAAASVQPAVLRFYANPSSDDVRALLRFDSAGARILCGLATRIFGQGLVESAPSRVRFRAYSRPHATRGYRGTRGMHFVRELCAGEHRRVFDSEFLLRDGRLYEAFSFPRVEVELSPSVSPSGGLVLESRRVTWRGLPLPTLGFRVRFEASLGAAGLEVVGTLSRRARSLGEIAYRVGMAV